MDERAIAGVEVHFTHYSKEVSDWINSRFDGDAREAAYETIRWVGGTFRMDDKLGIVTEVVGG
jgi:hypothetical protein